MKVLVTGSDGLAGNSLRRACAGSGHEFIFAGREDGDLRRFDDVIDLLNKFRPDCVINCAARVGGVQANLDLASDFLYDNLLINANVLKAGVASNVRRLIAFSSVCVFPDGLGLLTEDSMHSGPVYDSNAEYGYAKRMIDSHITGIKKQYGDYNYMSIIPGNIYGPNDMYDVVHGHCVPSLLHKFYLAKKSGKDVTIWGDGLSEREFLYIDDLSRVILGLLEVDMPQRLIVSGRQSITIRDLIDTIIHVTSFDGRVIWDASKPNGQFSRPTDKTKFDEYFPDFKYTSLRDGMTKTWNWFVENYDTARLSYGENN